MRGKEFLARLREQVLIGDGALGTMLSESGIGREACYERLNLVRPDLIRELHRAYVDAGAQVLETNTFGANHTKLARFDSAGDVRRHQPGRSSPGAGSGGCGQVRRGLCGAARRPVNLEATENLDDDDIRAQFREPIVALADAGADLLILETFTELRQLLLALEVAKSHTDLPVVCQMAFHERGHTYAGVHVSTAVEALSRAGADVIGATADAACAPSFQRSKR